MAEVFADTSGLAEYLLPNEPLHKAANSIVRQCWRSSTGLVTTNYVLCELVALFTSPLRVPRSRQVLILDAIRAANWIEVVHVDPDLDREAWALLKSRLDKEWSLSDCASFVLMQQRGLTDALTTDHHFEQAGFIRLLK